MEIKTIASSSEGNCYRIGHGNDVLMIECGIRFDKILEAFCFKLSGVSGCLVSHGHSDHSMSLQKVSGLGVDCYMTAGTKKETGIDNHRIKTIEYKKEFMVGNFKIYPFQTQHDAAEPCGFYIAIDWYRILFATDTFYIVPKFKGMTHILLECNYSKGILEKNVEKGIVPNILMNRIISSHFELENVKEFLRSNDLAKVEEIHLIHISKTNGDAEFFKREIQALTGKQITI